MRGWLAVGCVALLMSAHAAPAHAESVARAPSTILIDALTGEVLSAQNADAPRPAGTLGQLMIVLLSLEEAGLGGLRLEAPVAVSPVAAAGAAQIRDASVAAGSGIPLRADKTYLLSDLLKALVITSASEVAVATAEAIAGDVPACLELMNARARKLGMEATHYVNLGNVQLPPSSEAEATTARDLARLSQALLQHPVVLQWASLTGLPFDQGAALLRNVNRLLGTVPDVDGLQVSSTAASNGHGGKADAGSYSMVATARRGALRLVAVVLDASSSAARYAAAAELIEWGFAHYERLEVAREGEPLHLPIRVAGGSVAQLTPVAGQTFSLLRRRDEERDLRVRYQVPAVLAAPIARQQQIGEVIVEEHDQLLAVIPLLSPKRVASTSILSASLP